MAITKEHIRFSIHFAFHLKKNATEATAMICAAYGENAVSHATCKRRYQKFRKGDFSLKDESRAGRPEKIETDELQALLDINSAQTEKELAEQLGVTQQAISVRLHTMADIKDAIKLHHDNAPSHMAFIVANYLAQSNTPVVPQPPYSPDLAPCDFFLFPRLKRELKGKHWESVENIQKHVTTFLRDIPVEEFQRAFQAWQTRLRKCIDSGGGYFEEF
ncbi:Mariner Mos1 transposase [Acromyrmex echinatior]|uniref:Mariner Mos1 transposase n=1 Tax=Acromyrmex echinatior TaxID=103372 RepID=F4WY44_ACREC|nr:Mariner Mos1 transposase [Acromyrmex echinatior]